MNLGKLKNLLLQEIKIDYKKSSFKSTTILYPQKMHLDT